MKKYLLILSLLITSINFSQTKEVYSDTVWIPFFEDSVKVQPYLSNNPEKYRSTMTTILYNIEEKGQPYLDLLGRRQLWFVPKELSNQVETILKRQGLIVRYKREGY